MCGDLDEEDTDSRLEEMLYARFVAHARALLAGAPAQPQTASADNAHYMEKLYSDALSRAVKDCEQVAIAQRYERMIAQPVVFARLAGYLAAHMSLGEDPLRRVMEALMLGYAEGEVSDRERRDYAHGDVAARK